MKRLLTLGVVTAAAAIPAGCGGNGNAPITPAARLESGRIVLTSVGAQRIGLETAAARGIPAPPPIVTSWVGPLGVRHKVVKPVSRGATVAIPYSSVVYDPSGQAYTFVAVGQLTYAETPISIDRIDGATAYLRKGPRAGVRVVSTGAEELYGVQSGVLAQT